MSDLISRQFVELVVEYPDPELCTYKEYRGKPYYSIKYIENGEIYVGYGTYNPEVLSRYLREYFMPSAQPEVTEEAVKDYCRKRCLTILTNDYLYKLTSAQLEIVRCKDCIFYREYGCQRAFVYPEPEDFCSRAERREV